jgi:UDP-N-acetylmuramyl pentapeptide synthase
MHTFLKYIVVRILTWEARGVLRRYKPRIIAVTGSVGKTTTKDAVHAALAAHVRVRKSVKSFNSEIGVPLSILGLENAWHNPIAWLINIARGALLLLASGGYPEWLVLEVGADRPGDIRSVARWLRPDIVVITGVPEVPVHVEYFDSPEAVAREKRSLAEYLRPGGKLIINGDDDRLRDMQSSFRGACMTFGTGHENDFRASHEEILYRDGVPIGVRFRVDHDGSSIPVAVHGALGTPRVLAACAALAVAENAGIDAVSASEALKEWAPPPGRVRIIRGAQGSIILDDTYNSSPAAAAAALETLAEVAAKRRIAVLGDMLELGRYSPEQHRAIGKRAAAVVDVLITVGFRSRAMAEAARDAGLADIQVRSYEMDEAARAGDELERELREGDVVLVKGSESMRMERTVLEMMAEPDTAEELLVRMDPDWRSR